MKKEQKRFVQKTNKGKYVVYGHIYNTANGINYKPINESKVVFSYNIRELTKLLEQALKSKPSSFKNMTKFNKSGVYFIYRNNTVLYVGKTNRTGKQRLGELKHHYRSHTFNKKLLLERLNNKYHFNIEYLSDKIVTETINTNKEKKCLFDKERIAVKEYIKNKLKYKFMPTNNLHALEHFSIGVIGPKYND